MTTDHLKSSRRDGKLSTLIVGGLLIAALAIYFLLFAGGRAAPDAADDTQGSTAAATTDAADGTQGSTAAASQDATAAVPDSAQTSAPPAINGAVATADASAHETAGSKVPMTDEVASVALSGAFEDEADLLESEVSVESAPSSVTGPYAEALEARLAEFEDMGWTQVGSPTIESLEILEEHPGEEPPYVVVLACVDSSEVDIIDAQGNSLRNEGTPTRTANVYTLVQEDGTWTISEATFPEDPDC